MGRGSRASNTQRIQHGCSWPRVVIYEKRGEETDAEEKGGQGPAKKPRYDAAENRPAWVKESVAEAVRRGGKGQPGAPFKQPSGWRGGYQPRGPRGVNYMGGSGGGRGRGGGGSGSVSGAGPSRGRGDRGGGATEPHGGITRAEGGSGEPPALPAW